MEEMVSAARRTSEELGKFADMTESERNEIARIVGMGALKYFILKVDARKNMLFNPEESIDFNGNTGPFIQYTYARIRSVLRRAAEQGISLPETFDPKTLTLETKEQELVAKLAEYADVVADAARGFSPALIANYVYELVKEYNQFYHEHSILKEEDETKRAFRLALSEVISVIPHAFFGLVCSILYVKSGRNLYYSAILHALMNLSAVIPTPLS